MIVAQSRLAGVSVSQVARRYDVNANQVFNWRKDPKFAAEPEEVEDNDIGRFLPIEIVEPVCRDEVFSAAQGALLIELADGHRLKIIGSYDPEALAQLIRSLSR